RWTVRIGLDARRLAVLGAILVLLAALAGAAIIGSGLLRKQGPNPTVLDPTLWLAYQTCVRCDGSDEQIWLVHPDGTGSHRVSLVPGASRSPAVSPDGSLIAFSTIASSDAPSQIYVVGIDGSNPQ